MAKGAMMSPSSSFDGSIQSSVSSSPLQPTTYLSTDLSLRLSNSECRRHNSAHSRAESNNWPPVKSLLRTALHLRKQQCTFFVKVYMDGIAVGRKIDLYTHRDYDSLIKTLCHMFNTTIHLPDIDGMNSAKDHLLTYEDKEGDWMMVGDVPWELFLATVKKLKISRPDKC